MEKNLDCNYIRMLRANLNMSWRQHPTKQQLYGHLPPITKTVKVRRTRNCWRSRVELISDVLLWAPSHGQAKAGWPAPTYIQQLCEDTGCSPENPPEAINDREEWRERVRDIRTGGTTRWWWWRPSNENMTLWHVKFCWLFCEPLSHSSFHLIASGIMFVSYILFHRAEELIVWRC